MQAGREIKFRAWDRKQSKMVDMNHLRHHASGFRLLDEDREYEFMQFTGLRDKNGKEIYEGDILRYPDAYDSGSDWEETISVGAIEWDTNQAQFTVTNRHSVDLECLFEDIDETEVIGNVYENPELLEVDN
ncbi:YopX family protein [Brevibacillus fortis]|uniref:YopX family protein n=1 Tax=Brevibacillus fortis TaxID=2126352 RepID=UPI0038FC8FFA